MRDWTVQKRVFVTLAAVLIVLGAGSAVAWFSFSSLQRTSEVSLAASQLDRKAAERYAEHLAWVLALERTVSGTADFSGELDPTKCRLGQWLSEQGPSGGSADPEVRKLFQEIGRPHRELHESAAKVLALRRGGDAAGAREHFERSTLASLKEVGGHLGRIRGRSHRVSADGAKSLEAVIRNSRTEQVAFGAAGVLMAALLGYWLTGFVNGTLKGVIADLLTGSEQVESAAGQVAAASQSLARGSAEQAASIEETSASSEEVNAMARKNSDNSRMAAGLMQESQQRILRATRSLDEMVQAMDAIGAQSGAISKIIKVIDEIAFQTNILALNAAVEAARAGEAGMGFAIVADEVRNLAQRSAQAARDTAPLIEESIVKSSSGKAKVDQVAEAIHAVAEEFERVGALVEEVSVASQEQRRGIEQVSRSITRIGEVTQSGAEEGASAAAELTAQSENLKEIVGRLAALVGAGVPASSRRYA